jgi:hypothetical protein
MNHRVLFLLTRVLDEVGEAVRTPSGISPDRFGFRHEAQRRGLFHDEDGRL